MLKIRHSFSVKHTVMAMVNALIKGMCTATDGDDTHLKLADVDRLQRILQRLVPSGNNVIIRDRVLNQFILTNIGTMGR